jgi:hypothetical protein
MKQLSAHQSLIKLTSLCLLLALISTPVNAQRNRRINESTNKPSPATGTPFRARYHLVTVKSRSDSLTRPDPAEYRKLLNDYLELTKEITAKTEKLEAERKGFPAKVIKELLTSTIYELLAELTHGSLPKVSSFIKFLHYKDLLIFYIERIREPMNHEIELDNLESKLRQLDMRGTALGLWSDLMRAGFFSPPDDALIFTLTSVGALEEKQEVTIVESDDCDVPRITNMNPAARMAMCVSRKLLAVAGQVTDPGLRSFLLMASGATVHEVGGPINFQQVLSVYQTYRNLDDTEGKDLDKKQEALEKSLAAAKSGAEIEAIIASLDQLSEEMEKFNEKLDRVIWTNLQVSAPDQYIPIIKGNGQVRDRTDVVSAPRKPHQVSRLTVTNRTGTEIVLLIGQDIFRLGPNETVSKQLLADGYFIGAWLPFPPEQRNIIEGHSFLVLEEGKDYRANVAIADKSK